MITKNYGPIPLLINEPPQTNKVRDFILENCYKPRLKKGTQAYRIIQRLKSKGPLRHRDLYNLEMAWRRKNKDRVNTSFLYPSYELGLSYYQLIAKMLAYGQIQRISRGTYQYVKPIKFKTL